MAIRILAPHEAAKIAAGEVIERPASVVKELIENSLDAGATQITVEIREGGLALIRVVDDGCGIDPTELRLAFERHATSKVRSEEDLWRVATLGFRGEALPSIAAAGDIEVLSRVAGNDVGGRIRLRAGEVVDEGSGASAPGTSFTVRTLFSAQPARLKFLRAPASEAAQVSTAITHYAMAYPEVRFTLVIDGRATLQTPGSGDLRDAVAAVHGADVAEAAIAVDAPADHEGGTGVSGVVIEPRLHRSTRNYIGLYVNRRWVRNRALTFAVEEAYQGMLPVGRHPIAVLDLRLPPDEVDVNVHPTKAEVRLRREREVFGALQRAVRSALSAHAPVPSASPALWVGGGSTATVARPLVLRPQPVQTPLPSAVPEHLRAEASPDAPAPMLDRLPMLRAVGQVGNTYIIAEGPDGMYLIDQHAAHERALYEQFLQAARAGSAEKQALLDPVTVELGGARRALLHEHAASLERMGFDIEHFGDAAYVVRALPAALAGDDVARRVCELLDRMARDDGPDESAHRVAASLACHASVRAGMSMSEQEQRELLRLLEASEAPRTCPHGRPTMVHLTADALAREFRRK